MHEKIKQLIPNKLKSKFTTRPMLQKIFKNIGWMSVERIITLMIGLLVGILVARYLGPEDFGILSFIGAFFGLFLPFTYLGLSGIVQREIIKNKNNKKILGTAFFLRFLSSFFIFMLVPSIILFLFPGRMDYLIFSIICGVGMLFDSFGVISWYFSAKLISKKITIALVVSSLIVAFFKIGLIFTNQGLLYFFIANLIQVILLGLILIIMFFKKNNIFKWQFDFSLAKALLKESWPYLLSGLMVVIYLRIDQFMLGIMLGPSEVGIYSVAVKLSELPLFLAGAITMSLFPSIVKLKSNPVAYKKRIAQLIDFSIWFPIFMIIPIILFSDSIVFLLYGVKYINSSLVLSILTLGIPFIFLQQAVSKFILAEKLSKIALYKNVLGAFSNILLNLMLIPTYGVYGAAFATISSYFIVGYLSNAFFKETRELFFISVKSLNFFRVAKDFMELVK